MHNATLPRPTLEINDVSVSLGRGRNRRTIIHNVSMHITAGEVVGIIGESGSGKTTLARTIVGAIEARGGAILLDGQTIPAKGLDQQRFRRKGELQYVFQDPLLSLNPDRTIFWSIGEPLVSVNIPSHDEVRHAMTLARLDPGLADRRPGEISGGQRQRALIARALVTRPRFIIADEPVSALDASIRVEILDLLRSLAVEQHVGVGFISHDIGSVAGIADRIIVLYRGRVVEAGRTDQIILNPQHPYTKLLIGSTPSLFSRGLSINERIALKALIID
ncbi:ATP-binding cassette domain-containing protein [Rhizobium lusitanum]|uniref:ATP-binding cassette domain-containing protein n=2 Tax=Rhizobium lusitanum TaxID=293958 RepID=A0A6L9UHP5_9HYPH|nr:ATP-binding cassette domain-containing protein [Rhizobium lusitanum]